MKQTIRVFNYLLFFIGSIFWFYIIYRIIKYPENYVGWNILWVNGLFLISTLFSILDLREENRKRSLVIVTFSVVSITFIISIYFLDILIPYDLWVQKGMPERPF